MSVTSWVCVRMCVYECACMCVYVCMYVCVCVWVCMYVYVSVCACMCVCECACMCMCVHVCVCVWVCMYVCMSVCACMCVCQCVCMYVCVCVCILGWICTGNRSWMGRRLGGMSEHRKWSCNALVCSRMGLVSKGWGQEFIGVDWGYTRMGDRQWTGIGTRKFFSARSLEGFSEFSNCICLWAEALRRFIH